MQSLEFQRDSFIDQIYLSAKKNKDIYFLSADFGAPALDRFRRDLGGVEEAYQEVARRLGILPENSKLDLVHSE